MCCEDLFNLPFNQHLLKVKLDMPEVDLPNLADTSNGPDKAELKTPIQEVNAALKECGFGIFHIRLLLASFIGVTSAQIISSTTSYLLPTAECDLHMSLEQKGLLNSMPYLGMLFSSLIAGFLTDAFGRKLFITTGYSGIFLATFVSASSQTFSLLIAAKFFEGALSAAAFSATLTLTSEFCHNEIRDRVLIFRSSFKSIAAIVIAGMSWGVLINDWQLSFFNGAYVLNTWNFYLYIMSLWSLSACTLYMFIPESPKYLVTQNKFNEARAILIKIYKTNTGYSEDKFLYKDLWKKSMVPIPEETESQVKSSITHQLVVGLYNTKRMFQKPLVTHLLLTCGMNFATMALFNVLRLWYPQVSAIVENNSFITSDGVHQDLCGMLDTYTNRLQVKNSTTSAVCIAVKSGSETYINSIIIGCVCMIPYFISGVMVNKLGKKPLLIASSLVAVATTIGLRFADSKTAVVSLFAVVIAIAQMPMTLFLASAIEFFPTSSRTLAISIIMTVGRIGTWIGNISFPVLLKMGCDIPFYTLAGMMLCVAIMAVFLPTKRDRLPNIQRVTKVTKL